MSTQIKKMSLSQFMDFMAENIVDTTETVRISEGDATPREVLEELVNEIPERGFCGRLSRYLTKNKRAIKSFESSFHKQQFASLITSKNCVDTDYMAALYLLTADEATWRSVREFVGKEGIKYEITDLLYHLMFMMVEKGVTWEEITEEERDEWRKKWNQNAS